MEVNFPVLLGVTRSRSLREAIWSHSDDAERVRQWELCDRGAGQHAPCKQLSNANPGQCFGNRMGVSIAYVFASTLEFWSSCVAVVVVAKLYMGQGEGFLECGLVRG